MSAPIARLLAMLFVALLILCDAEKTSAQSGSMEDCAGGTHYLLAFPDTTTNVTDSRFPPQITRTNQTGFFFNIYSPVDQMLRIGRANGLDMTIPISEGQILEYNTASIGSPLITVINQPQSNVIEIESQYPVIVYGYMLTAYGCEAYTAIPVESWGTEYYAAAWPGENVYNVFPITEANYRAFPKEGEGEILIIAAEDSTQVTIDPKASLRNASSPLRIVLNAGEAFLVQSTTDTSVVAEVQPDLGGSLIQASKRIGVISGNPRIMHNKGKRPTLAGNSFMNMNIEWLPPVEQHGTEFVFMPTYDDRRQRQGLDPEEWREAELVRIFGTSEGETTGIWIDSLGASVKTVTDTFTAGEFTEEKIETPVARYFKTSQPAFAVSSPYGVIKFINISTGSQYVGASYLSWSSYMVEMVPREQWTSFAPVKAPSLPIGMTHYLNIVTDSLDQLNVYYQQRGNTPQIFPFNRGTVPGTNLVWGSIQLNTDVDYVIIGDKGARFTGYAYGSYRGQEDFRPGGTKRDDEKESSINGGETSEAGLLHLAEYQEDVALMYGFPLAPSRCILAQSDEYEIVTTQDCDVMKVEITTKNDPAIGIRSIKLLPDSSENARLEFIEPVSPLEFQSSKILEAKLRLVAINPQRDARAVVIIEDRTRESRRWRIEYKWEAERVTTDPLEIDFGTVALNTTAGERMVAITNPLPSKSIVVKHLQMVFGTEGFVITRTDPPFNWRDNTDSVVLGPGESMRVWLDITPTEKRDYLDSLHIRFGCTDRTFPVRASGGLSCLMVGDLDFGTMRINQSKTLDLEVCNVGDTGVTFQDPWLTWLKTRAAQQGFSVAQSEIDKLKGAILRKDECITLQVSFSATRLGTFGTTARLHANSRSCRDTSDWHAVVSDVSTGIAGDEDLTGYAIAAVTPNPTNGETKIDFRIGRRAHTTVEVYTADGEYVATLLDKQMNAGEQSVLWNAEGNPAGLYHIQIRSGEWSDTRQVVLMR